MVGLGYSDCDHSDGAGILRGNGAGSGLSDGDGYSNGCGDGGGGGSTDVCNQIDSFDCTNGYGCGRSDGFGYDHHDG